MALKVCNDCGKEFQQITIGKKLDPLFGVVFGVAMWCLAFCVGMPWGLIPAGLGSMFIYQSVKRKSKISETLSNKCPSCNGSNTFDYESPKGREVAAMWEAKTKTASKEP